MASFPAFLPNIRPSKSAMFRDSLMNVTAKTTSSHVHLAAVDPASEMSSITMENKISNILYSTPLQKTPTYHHIDTFSTQEHGIQEAVKKIKSTLVASEFSKRNQLEDLIMIDTIQRLGLEHYFREDIHALLQRHYEKCWNFKQGLGCFDDLHEISLGFRLLRQEGYHVAADVFNEFKDNNGNFKLESSKDIKGLINLFEASHISKEGEHILDEAAGFSAHLLETSLNNLGQSEATIVANSLANPYLRSLPRLMGKNFLNCLEPSLKLLHNFEDSMAWTKDVRDLAKMDFRMTQITHQIEIARVHRWWKELDLTKELKFARDHPVKWHIWSLAALPNPSLKEERIRLTKPISFIYLIDDIFDVYGSFEELTIFTQAVNRWTYADIEGLPDYMKMCLKALQDTTDDFSKQIYAQYGWDPKSTLKKAWADLCNAFLLEAKWFRSGRLPSSEEYLKNGLVSSGMQVVAVHIFYLLGQGINAQSIDHLNNFPNLVSSMATVLRLSDDLGSSKDENQDGYDGSFIECYKNEHKQICDEMAKDSMNGLISDAWKCLNNIYVSPSPYSTEFVAACISLTRMVPMMYSYDHNHRLPCLEKHMKSFLYEIVD